MPAQIGDAIPEAVLQYVDTGVERVDTPTLFEDKRVVLFAVPGAFTPTCSERHLPGYVEQFDAFRNQGVDVYCLAVNDPFVMKAWGESQNVPTGLKMLADGNGDFTRALGLDTDASAFGMGTRSKRYAMYVEDGVIRDLQVEAPGELRVSTAESMLQRIS